MLEKFLYSIARPLLFSLNAETAHNLTLAYLRRAEKIGLTKIIARPQSNPKIVMGITFPNPVGLAAGLDKDGAYIDGLAALGFGFIEIGTVTPRPQPGNSAPRMFRLPNAKAIINRMGFNNGGVESFIENIRGSKFYQNKEGILGLNIGKNADTPIDRAIDDYLYCLEKIYQYAHYVTINISSPNTKNLRQLQNDAELDSLLTKLKEMQHRLAERYKRYVPIALKIAPDISPEQVKNIASALLRHKIDGVIATNTTISREAVRGMQHAEETGGLSGSPVFDSSTMIINLLKAELNGEVPIIGTGGILSGKHARAKIDAGASLIQLYTGLIYRGPALIKECAAELHNDSQNY